MLPIGIAKNDCDPASVTGQAPNNNGVNSNDDAKITDAHTKKHLNKPDLLFYAVLVLNFCLRKKSISEIKMSKRLTAVVAITFPKK